MKRMHEFSKRKMK